MNKTYLIAGISIRIESHFDYPLYKEAKRFEIDCQNPDIVFSFEKINSFRDLLIDEIVVSSNELFHVLKVNDKEYRGFHQGGYLYALVYIDGHKGYCYYEDEVFLVNKMCSGPKDMTFICLEKYLLEYQAMILHSSYIQYNDDGIVITAPSGTGKSTHAELWRHYRDAKVINGDRSILRKEDNIWYVHGIPMNGTSAISYNISLPLKAIVILKRDQVNHVEEIKSLEKFKAIYSEVTINYWNSEYVLQIMSLIDELINDVPIYVLFANKEKDAVDCLYKQLYGGQQ